MATVPSDERFRAQIKEYRDRHSWSQERLAEEADMDHSLVSRLESGQRTPTREAVGKLGDGLRLGDGQRDMLLVLAGFAPDDPANFLALHEEHALADVYRLLSDPQVSATTKEQLRAQIGGLVSLVQDHEPQRKGAW